MSQVQRTIALCNGAGDRAAVNAVARAIVRSAIRVYAAWGAGISFLELR